MADIDTAERLLCARYNVVSLDDVGPFADAVRSARGGDLGPLRAAVRDREMYQWGAAIEIALAEPDVPPLGSPVDEASEELAPAASSEAQPEPASESDAEPEDDPEQPVRHRGRRPRPDPE